MVSILSFKECFTSIATDCTFIAFAFLNVCHAWRDHVRCFFVNLYAIYKVHKFSMVQWGYENYRVRNRAYEKQSTTCLSLKSMICRLSRATAVNWTLLEGISTDSKHLMLAGIFCDQIRFPFDEKLCKQSSIVPTIMVFSRRINPTAYKVKNYIFSLIAVWSKCHKSCLHGEWICLSRAELT